MKLPELLLPASSLEVLKVAVMFGADAVYLGGQSFGLRAKAKNFTPEEMREGIEFAHKHGKKVYITVNIFAHNDDLDGIPEYFKSLYEMGADGVLISDPGVFNICRKVTPELPIHISTQANNTNYATYNFWYDMGVRRVVCARELSLEEIKVIRENIPEDMEIETFVHGAMCISYSGRCLLSTFLTGRDANRGECTHPCRWEYSLVEDKRPGVHFPIEEDDRGSYILNAKDLCMIDHLPEMIESGINCLKIEGRMKNALYVATMARAYRRALDLCGDSYEKYESKKDELREAVNDCTHRPYGTGFFMGRPGPEGMIYDESTYVREYTYLGYVDSVEDNYIWLNQKNKFTIGETIEVMCANGDNKTCKVTSIWDEYGNSMESAPHAKQRIKVDIGYVPNPYDILRKKED